MEKSKFWRYVALGLAAVLLVFFITQFVRSFGEATRENMDIRDAFEQVKVEESKNEQPAVTVYMTLNWHEFSDKVVIQVGNNSYNPGNGERGHLQKDAGYWYYVFGKDGNTINLEGLFGMQTWTSIFASGLTDYYMPINEPNAWNIDILGLMQHEFENYYTGDIVKIDNTPVRGNVSWQPFTGVRVSNIRGTDYYRSIDSVNYLPVDGSYRISMFDASLTAPVLLKQCYQYVDNEDVMLDLSEQYFCCYSNSVAKTYNDIMKGYIPFDLRMFIDYTPHLTTAFDFDNLRNMYNLVKDYNYYVG